MTVYLLRHGETEYNTQRRYLGRTDLPLSPKGRADLVPGDFSPGIVYVSPLRRAVETAELLFPDAETEAVPGLREMDFGIFEGRSAAEMSGDPAYRQWVDGFCQGPVPGGESKDSFSRRTCRAFAALLDGAADRGEESLAVVAHGGTQMAVLERYALPRRDYFSWRAPPGGGFVLDAGRWREERVLTLLDTVRYTGGGR